MRTRTGLLSVVLLVAFVALASGASSVEPVVLVARNQGLWLNQITMNADVENAQTFYIYLGVAEGDPLTGHFAGPADDDDYDLTYSVDGEEVDNEFDVTLAEGETMVVQLVVAPVGVPRRFLLAEFTLTDEEGGGPTAEAHINLVVPGDLMVRMQDDLLWAGEDAYSDSLRPWTGEDIPTAVTRWKVPYSVKLVNAENAHVSYDLRVQILGGNGLVARYYLGAQEITDDITSDDGYRTAFLSPGEELTVTANLMPVGSDMYLREVSFEAAVAEVQIPPLDLSGPIATMSPFAIYYDEVPDAAGETFVLYAKDKLAPGNFGLVDFNGGSNPTPELRDWILNGYALTVEDDVEFMWLPGDPGWRETLLDTMQVKIDDEAHMLGVVYDDSRGPGNNAEVRMISIVEYVPIEAADKQILARYVGTRSLSQFWSIFAFDAVNFGATPKWRVRIEGWEELEDGVTDAAPQ